MKIWIIIFLLIPTQFLGQVDCVETDNKKVLKLLEKCKSSKFSVDQKFDFLEEAIEEDEECVECHFQLGVRKYKRARSEGSGYAEALDELNWMKTNCPDWSSDIFFYLGVINYANEDWQTANDIFEMHQDFSVEENRSRDYKQKYADVEEVMLELGFKLASSDQKNIVKSKVKGVSSSKDEYLPTLSMDNELMFYTRKYEKKAKGDFVSKPVEEFSLSSRIGVQDEFDKGKSLAAPFNRGENYGGATISIDNSEMYITICKTSVSGKINCDIYHSRYEKMLNPVTKNEEFNWTEFENLGPEINTEDGWESQPSLNAEGDILYFATARETTIKNSSGVHGMDIFYSTKQSNGKWGQAQSLGDVINGPGNEKSPFMHGDSKTLYFSSDGLTGVGKYDIYFSRLSEDGTWSKPRNLGIPINTEHDEHGMIVSTDGTTAYYASNRLEGAEGYDIFTFPMPEIAKPDKVILVKGDLVDEKGEAIDNVSLELNYINSKKVEKVDVDNNGHYAKMINVENEPVVFQMDKDGYAFKARVFSKEDAEETPVVKSSITMEKIEVGRPYTINDINYMTASSEINEESKLILNSFAEYLDDHPKIKISIQGHTDNVGSEESNQKLSTQRAAQVMAYLIERQVAPGRMNFKGFGSSKPMVKNNSEENRLKNRRTEFVIDAF